MYLFVSHSHDAASFAAALRAALRIVYIQSDFVTLGWNSAGRNDFLIFFRSAFFPA